MRGFRTQESLKFERFWDVVQCTAEKQGKMFFCENGEGRDFETEDMEGEDLCGWLIPLEQADEFEAVWKSGHVDDEWCESMVWAIWQDNGGIITAAFKKF